MQSLYTRIIDHFVRTLSYSVHTLHGLTDCPSLLFLEFVCIRRLHQNALIISTSLLFLCSILNLVLLWFPMFRLIPIILCVLLLSHDIHRRLMHPHPFYVSWSEQLDQTLMTLEHSVSGFISKITFLWFRSAFLYHIHLVQAQIHKETERISMCFIQSVPKEVNGIIADYLFHAPIQQLAAELMIAGILKQKLNRFVVQQIIQNIFDFSDSNRVSIRVCHGHKSSKYGGALSGTFSMNGSSNSMRSMHLTVCYGDGISTKAVSSGLSLEYDPVSRQLVHAQHIDI